jgi:hypothetical protein
LNGDEFKSFRSSVPKNISDLLNLDAINFQGQHDPVYWFSETSGEVSRQLNSMVDLGVVDDTLAHVIRAVSRAKTAVQVTEDRLAEAVERKESLAWVPECDEDFKRVERLKGELEEIELKVGRTDRRIYDAEVATGRKEESRQACEDGQRVLKAAKRAGKTTRDRDALSQVLALVRESERESSRDVPDVAPIAAIKARWEELGVSRARLRSVLCAAREGASDAIAARRRADEALEDLEEQIGGRCPLCGGEVNKQRRK